MGSGSTDASTEQDELGAHESKREKRKERSIHN